MIKTKDKSLLRRAYLYFRHDVREILFPSSLPDPPGYVAPPPKTLKEKISIFRWAVRQYIDSWDSEKLQRDLRRRRREKGIIDDEEEDEEAYRQSKREFDKLKEEIQNSSRAGARNAWPYLQYMYKTRARAYRDAVSQFIEGYKEGFREAHSDKSSANQRLDQNEIRQEQRDGKHDEATKPSQ